MHEIRGQIDEIEFCIELSNDITTKHFSNGVFIRHTCSLRQAREPQSIWQSHTLLPSGSFAPPLTR